MCSGRATLPRVSLRRGSPEREDGSELPGGSVYPSDMICRLARPLLVAIALIWLPMSAFAQHCATAGVFTQVGGHDHPALPQPTDADYEPLPAHVAVVDPTLFWQAVDEYGACGPSPALCALAFVPALAHAPAVGMPMALNEIPARSEPGFRSHVSRPDTPPPRT